MSYAALYLLPIREDDLQAYRDIANQWNKIFLEHGGVDHREWVVENHEVTDEILPIPSSAKEGERMVFSVVECNDKEHYETVMEKMQQDPRLKEVEMGIVDMERMQLSEFSLLAGRGSA